MRLLLKSKTFRIFLVIFTLAFGFFAFADNTGFVFENNEMVCFIGDSITHVGRYHSLISLFYATRFPDRIINIYNCGIGGDTAAGVLERIDWDIKPYNPDVAAIMLGMNDVGRSNYGENQKDETKLKARNQSLQHYNENMQMLVSKLGETGCRILFMTPSIYDQTAKIDAYNYYGVNDALGNCSDANKRLCKQYGWGLVDHYSMMNEINSKLQQIDPKLTIVGADRIHPGPDGHFVMAYSFLKAQGVSKHVSKAVINYQDMQVDLINCELSFLTKSINGLSFQYLAKSLPFPVPADIKQALDYVPFQQDLNQEFLQVKHLKPGTYELFINDYKIGSFDSLQLEEGVNLANYTNTPQYRQSMRIAEINKQRHELNQDLRTILFVEHKMLKKRIAGSFDMDEIKVALTKCLEKRKNTSTYNNYLRKVNLYYDKKHKENEMRQQLDRLRQDIYAINQPKKLSYALVLK